jgi:hypothetical protein
MVHGEFRAEGAAENTAEKNAANGIELLVSEISNSQPDGEAEGAHDEGAAAGAGGEKDRQAGEKAGSGIERAGDSARCEPAREQAVVDVSAVGCEDGLAADGAASDG